MKVDLDFTNVKSSDKIRVPEGDYLAKVSKVEKTKSKSSNNPMLVITFTLLSGGQGAEGKTIKDNHVLTETSLWTLRNMLEAMGYSVPASKMTFNDKMVIGKKVGLTLIDGEEYKGRISSEVADYIPPSVVGNRVTSDEVEADEDDESDDGFLADEEDSEDEGFAFDDEEDSDDGDETEDSEDDEESDEDDDEDEGFSFDDDDEEDEEEEGVALSFDSDDVESAKAPELKTYFKEATDAGFEFDLPKKAKASDVRDALLSLFAEDDEDDDEMEDFDLDDVE